jgi:hypothetical protein
MACKVWLTCNSITVRHVDSNQFRFQTECNISFGVDDITTYESYSALRNFLSKITISRFVFEDSCSWFYAPDRS